MIPILKAEPEKNEAGKHERCTYPDGSQTDLRLEVAVVAFDESIGNEIV